jgi:CNH domain
MNGAKSLKLLPFRKGSSSEAIESTVRLRSVSTNRLYVVHDTHHLDLADDSRRIAYGTDDGVYFSDIREPNRAPVKVLALLEVTQVEILQQSQLLIVLSERNVITFPLEVLDPMDPTAGQKRGKRIAAHTSFFKAGICMGRPIVCVVKTSALSTTVKTFEPIDQQIRGKSKPTFKKLLQGGNDTLKLFKVVFLQCGPLSLKFTRHLGILYSRRIAFAHHSSVSSVYWVCSRIPDRGFRVSGYPTIGGSL